MTAESFAVVLLARLRELDPEAQALKKGPARRGGVTLGIDDEGFQPLMRLSAGSAKLNVMGLFVRRHHSWFPTFQRGTPGELAQQLAGPLRHLWAIPLSMAEPWPPENGES